MDFKKYKLLAVSVLAVVTLFLIACGYYWTHPLDYLTIEEVKEIVIIPFSMDGNRKSKVIFDLSEKKQKKQLSEIINWIKEAKYKGRANNEAQGITYNPTTLNIVLKNGKSISIKSSNGYILTKTKAGKEMRSYSIIGQVTICSDNSRQPFRLFAPELKLFIEKEWVAINE